MKINETADRASDAHPTDSKSVLEQRLADLEAAVRRQQEHWVAVRDAASEPQDNLAEIISSERGARIALERELARRQEQYERDIARATAVRAMVDEQLREASLEVERARHAEASAAAAVDRLTRAEAEAVTRLAEREEGFATERSRFTAARDGLEQQVSDLESALASATHRHRLAATEVERLTRRETELSAQCADEEATRATLEHRVAEVEAALAAVSEQISRERALAGELQATYEAQIQEENAKRRCVEDTLASAQAVHADTEKRHESAIAVAAAALAERDSNLASMRAEASAVRSALERRAADAEAALSDADQQHRSALDAAATRLAEREAQFATELMSITATRDSLQEQLRDVDARLIQETGARQALEEAISELQSSAAEAERRFRDQIAAITERAHAERANLENQISRERHDHETRLADEKEQHQSALATAATRLAEREAQFATELTSLTATRDSLEAQLIGLETRVAQETENRTALELAIAEMRSAATEAERRFREETATLAGTVRAERARLEEQISRERHDHETRLADENEQHQSAIATAATRLAEREAQFATELATITATRNSVQEQVIDLEARLAQESDARTALELGIAEVRSAATEAERRFREETATLAANARAERTRLEEQISRERHEHETRLADEKEQHQSAIATAATRLAEREAQFATELASITATRNSLQEQVIDLEARLAQESDARTALELAVAEVRAAGAEAAQRFRDEIAALTEKAQRERASLENQICRERHDHETQRADEQEQHRSALAAAATRRAEREAQFATALASITATRKRLQQQVIDLEARVAHETETRTALELAIAEVRSEAAHGERRLRDEIAAITEKAQAERASLENQICREQHDHETQRADEQEQHRSAMATAATRLAEREAQFATELATITATRNRLEAQLIGLETRVTQETENRTALELAIADVRSAATEAERRFREEIATISENAHAERARLEGEISRERTLAADRLAARGAEFEAELERLSGAHTSALTRLQASIAERDARIEEQARAAASLQNRLDASEAENRRQFEQTSVPLIRCTRDGAVADANQAFAALVGCRTPGELRDKNFAATCFESRDDLAWLIERSGNARYTESVETAFTRKDGARVAVRLSARPSVSALVEIAAEDLTGVRVLEDRLRESHRMEAVGRLASEIAVTCEKLLGDVHRDAQRLVTSMTGSKAHRERADTLLDDMTRARKFLHQLVAYEHQQAAALTPVDLNRVLRDLQPVLKQVAGDAVTLELPKTSSPVTVDVNAERVERLLVNVASYGRERMPDGGRLRIELSTVVVDGKFISQYPNVRQGLHALITVTEVARRTAEGLVSNRAGEPQSRSASERPGVDLGALQELISECGGHLWITAEPGGNMVVKIRLPLRATWEGQADANARRSLGRMTARLLGR